MIAERRRLEITDLGDVVLRVDRLDPDWGWDYDRTERLGEAGLCTVPEAFEKEYEARLGEWRGGLSLAELHAEWTEDYWATRGL